MNADTKHLNILFFGYGTFSPAAAMVTSSRRAGVWFAGKEAGAKATSCSVSECAAAAVLFTNSEPRLAPTAISRDRVTKLDTGNECMMSDRKWPADTAHRKSSTLNSAWWKPEDTRRVAASYVNRYAATAHLTR